MEEADFRRFHTELGKVLGYIRFSEDKDALARYVEGGGFEDIAADTAWLINAATGSKLRLVEREGKVDMCTAIEEMRREERNGGRIEGALGVLAGLVEDGVLTVPEAAARAGLTEDEFAQRMALLNL